MAGIWPDALDAPDVGVHDDFFELGGHTVLAVRLMAATHKERSPRNRFAVEFYPSVRGRFMAPGRGSGIIIEK